jgi:hypothetical protein
LSRQAHRGALRGKLGGRCGALIQGLGALRLSHFRFHACHPCAGICIGCQALLRRHAAPNIIDDLIDAGFGQQAPGRLKRGHVNAGSGFRLGRLGNRDTSADQRTCARGVIT